MAITWRLVPIEEVGLVWSTVAPILATSIDCDDGRRSLHSVLRQLVNGENQLWVVTDIDPIGAVVTAILHYPHKRVLRVEWLAGERFSEWAHLIGVLEDWAREQQCASVEIAGRMGFARVFRNYGYAVTGFEGSKLLNA
jgi:hypothetical protein